MSQSNMKVDIKYCILKELKIDFIKDCFSSELLQNRIC